MLVLWRFGMMDVGDVLKLESENLGSRVLESESEAR